MTQIPVNCTECQYTKNCQSYYGGPSCLFRDAINQKRLNLLVEIKKLFKK